MKMEFCERVMIPERVRIPVLGGIWYRYLCKKKREEIRRVPINSLSLNKEKRNTKLIFTLTSFPDRIDSVQYTLRTLFMQSMKPDRVILWLAKDEFENVSFPESILEFQQIGLEIRYCDNLYGHKRYYCLVPEQKENECIVMFDDDILFPKYLVERLYKTWEKNRNCIVCDRGQVMTTTEAGVLNPGRWSSISKVGLKTPSYRLLASPGGGCLIPPGALYKDACNSELIQKYAIKTGDIWLMFMAVQNDTKIIRTYRYHRTFILSEEEQTVQLGREAIYQGRYLVTFEALSKAYPHAYENMVEEAKDATR